MLGMLIIATIVLVIASDLKFVDALDNGLALTPPMGWLAWERFVCDIDCVKYPNQCLNYDLFAQMAEKLEQDGFKKAGYEYVNIDDCWSERQRDQKTNRLLPDKARFKGDSLKPLADHVHKLGLKLGLYGDCGTKTCQNYPGLLKHDDSLIGNYFTIDAHTFAEWQIDSYKMDACNVVVKKSHRMCPQMGAALNKTGRPILFTCSWPAYENDVNYQTNWSLVVERCNLFRAFGDIEDSWSSVLSTIDAFVAKQKTVVRYHGPGHWFDADQLVIGNFGLSPNQEQAQMAVWCIWSVPLFMSNDLRSINQGSSALLRNEHAISINQDKMGIFGLMVHEHRPTNNSAPELQVFVKPILPLDSDGCPSYAIVYLDRKTLGNHREIELPLKALLDRAHAMYTAADKWQWTKWAKCAQRQQTTENDLVAFDVFDAFADNLLIQSQLQLATGILRLRVNPSGARLVRLERVPTDKM